ncbi:protein LNK2 isoform X1 [Dendrobium catenatum]|uniref:protein LNK2 isoform X1 n=2 Tax=Dendrobium catenatum TaxID=906689 RepID=UPI0009F22607|nr:protein LNK2 isoform X1 [Dendrobium catenatum]
MINWNDQDQVVDTLWGEHKEIEDHIVPQPKERDGNIFSKFERCSKKQRSEDDCNAISSAMETCGTKNNFLVCNVKTSSSSNTSQELNDASIDMDSWPDLPNLSMSFGGGFNDEIVQDSVVTGLVSDLDNTSDLKSVGGFMEEYNHSSGLLHDKDSSSLSKTSILLNGNEMQLNGEPELFGHDEKENDKFMDYDWADIEDFGDLDKMFRSNDSIFGNEMIDNTDTFLTASAELISCTSQSIPVPDIPIAREQAWEEGSSSHHLGEHSNVKVNPSQKGKADMENQTQRTKKNKEEKGKGGSSQGLNKFLYNENQQISSPKLQASAMNTLPTFQSQLLEQANSSHHIMLTDFGYPGYQFHGMPLPPQIHAARNQHKPVSGSFKAHLDFSKHSKPVGTSSKPLIMTPQEKIEKLRRRQQMQAMLAIQKQREQYNHQISGSDEAPSLACLQNNQNHGVTRNTGVVEELAQKLLSSDASSLAEQDQSQMISSSLDGHSVEEAIYYQLQDAMGKLDMNVRLSIRDSLYRLARSAMERQNISDRSSTNKGNKEEDEISADEESNNQNRYSRLIDSEAVTNPIDRIVAHLLFHNPSGSSLMPIADAASQHKLKESL